MFKKGKKVIVGMSGGVDSTVAAVLLKKEGYDVEGVFLEFWKDKKSEEGFESAKKMADTLNIPLEKINAEDEFKRLVVDEFVKEYKEGKTPNPCIICNPTMKFKILLEEMNTKNADFIATGHYACVRQEFPISNSQFLNKSKSAKHKDIIHLLKAKDKTKDQSYFLYRLKADQLSKAIFPLGGYLKSQVREIARELGLDVADRGESQDICFVAQNNFEDFLKGYIEDKPGKIQDSSGKDLGEHKGLHFYTIGQRKGINLGGDGPYYVVSKDIENNVLVVSNRKKKEDLLRTDFLIKDANWIHKNIHFPFKVGVKVRYHSLPVRATIVEVKSDKEIYDIRLDKAQEAITPGQSAVFYDGDEILGGGVII